MRFPRLVTAALPFALLFLAATGAFGAVDVAISLETAAQAPITGQTSVVIVVHNVGTSAATGTQVAYVPPSQVTFAKASSSTSGVTCTTPAAGTSGNVQCNIPPMAASQTVRITILHNVPGSVASGTQLTFDSIVAAPGDTNANNDTASATIVAQPKPNVSIDSTFPSTFVGGTTVSYTLTVRNLGSAASNIRFDATTDQGTRAQYVSVIQRSGPTASCTLPSSGHPRTTWGCTFNTLNAAASATFDVQLAFDPIEFGFPVEEDLSVYSDAMLLVLGGATKKGIGTQVADVSVTGSAPSSVRTGDDVAFSVDVTNAGPSSSSPTLTWTTPSGTTFVSVTPSTNCTAPAAGASGSVTCSLINGVSPGTTSHYVFRANTSAPGTIVNTATVTGTNDPTSANNTASVSTTVIEPAKADLSLTMRADAFAVAGKPFTVLFIFRNTGPDTAKNVAAAFPLPPGISGDPSSPCPVGSVNAVCSVGDLASGAEVTKALVVNAAPALTQATFTATATSATLDPNPDNNSAATSIPVYPPFADVGIRVAPLPAVVPPGAELLLDVTVSNAGPAPATSGLTIDFPAGSTFISAPGCVNLNSGAGVACSAQLFPDASAQFRVHIAGPMTPGTYSLPFRLTSNVPDANPSDNEVTLSFAVSDTQQPGADLALSIDPAEVSVAPGARLTLNVAVENRGTNVANGVAVRGTLPASTTLLSATSPDGACGPTGIDCTIPTLGVGSSASIKLVVTAPATTGTTVVDLSASASIADPNASNNTVRFRVTVVDHPRRRPAGH